MTTRESNRVLEQLLQDAEQRLAACDEQLEQLRQSIEHPNETLQRQLHEDWDGERLKALEQELAGAKQDLKCLEGLSVGLGRLVRRQSLALRTSTPSVHRQRLEDVKEAHEQLGKRYPQWAEYLADIRGGNSNEPLTG